MRACGTRVMSDKSHLTIDFYRGLLDIMPGMLFVKDSDGRFIECSRAFVSYMGRTSAEEILGKTDYDFYPRALADRFARDDAYVRTLPVGQSYDFEQDDPAPDGGRSSSISSSSPMSPSPSTSWARSSSRGYGILSGL